jgi:hypothetical protein
MCGLSGGWSSSLALLAAWAAATSLHFGSAGDKFLLSLCFRIPEAVMLLLKPKTSAHAMVARTFAIIGIKFL